MWANCDRGRTQVNVAVAAKERRGNNDDPVEWDFMYAKICDGEKERKNVDRDAICARVKVYVPRQFFTIVICAGDARVARATRLRVCCACNSVIARPERRACEVGSQQTRIHIRIYVHLWILLYLQVSRNRFDECTNMYASSRRWSGFYMYTLIFYNTLTQRVILLYYFWTNGLNRFSVHHHYERVRLWRFRSHYQLIPPILNNTKPFRVRVS